MKEPTQRRREIAQALFASAAGSLLAPEDAAAQSRATGNHARTASEIALGIVPSNTGYPADPYVDPRRYGADPKHNVEKVVATTAAMQAALRVAYRDKGMVWIGSGCDYYCNALSLTLTGNRSTDGLRIAGAAINGSRLTFNPSAKTGLTLNGSTPTGNPQESPITLENFSVICSGRATDALVLNGISGWKVRNIYIAGAHRSIYVNSALTGLIADCWLDRGNYGVYARTNGGGAPPNLLRIENNVLSDHAVYAVDYDTGSELHLIGNDIEQNGTQAEAASGAIHIGAHINCAPTFGFAKIWMENNWIEQNLGGWAVLVDSPALGQQTHISIRGGHIVGSASGRALNVLGARFLLLEDLYSPTPGDTWNLHAYAAVLRNTSVSSLIDGEIAHPTYENVATSTLFQLTGRREIQPLTLTGVTGKSPAGEVTVHQQGSEISLELKAPIVGSSNSTAATLIGLGRRYWPETDAIGALLTRDAGKDSIRHCLVSAATGEIILSYGQPMSDSGTKGAIAGSIRYRRG